MIYTYIYMLLVMSKVNQNWIVSPIKTTISQPTNLFLTPPGEMQSIWFDSAHSIFLMQHNFWQVLPISVIANTFFFVFLCIRLYARVCVCVYVWISPTHIRGPQNLSKCFLTYPVWAHVHFSFNEWMRWAHKRMTEISIKKREMWSQDITRPHFSAVLKIAYMNKLHSAWHSSRFV